MKTFKINGRIPSKKNSVIIAVLKGKVMKFPSKEYKAWNKSAIEQLSYVGQKLENVKNITISFMLPDKRKTDLTNKAESVMDTLVDAGILLDDNCNVVPELTLKYLGVSKDPHCMIDIYDL